MANPYIRTQALGSYIVATATLSGEPDEEIAII